MATQHIIKKAIGEGTKDLMRQKTVNEISVTEICEKVGISRRNFYRYFQDKYEVVQWIYYHDSLMEVKHYADWTIWDHICNMTFDAFVNWLSEDPCLPPEAFAEQFTTAFQKASGISVELLTRAPGSTEAPVAFEPDEPSKK